LKIKLYEKKSKEIMKGDFVMSTTIKKDPPEILVKELADFLGTNETIRTMHLPDAPTLSKMKNPPDLANMGNNHRYSPFEVIQFIAEKISVEIMNAGKENNKDRVRAGRELQRRMAFFCSSIFECKMIPDRKWNLVKEVFQGLGMCIFA